MSVYVDDSRIGWRGKEWSHLMADDTEELHTFAARLGLKRAWFQPGRKPWLDHYDVTEPVRLRAIAAGAVAQTSEENVARIRQRRKEQT